MKNNILPVCVSLPILVSALILIGAKSPTPNMKADADGDGMPDIFEQKFHLDYKNSTDALLDYDGDSWVNAREAVFGTDPFAQDTDGDMIPDDLDENPVSRFFLQWGSPFFTDGDLYDYAKPNYCLGAWKDGGKWFSTINSKAGLVVRKVGELSTQSGWHAASRKSNVVESLNVALDRTILTNNLVYAIHYIDSAQATLYLDLLADTGEVILEDLYGNLMGGSNEEAVVLLDVPTAAFTNAAVLQLRRGTGDVTVYAGMIYIDEDADGLDAEFERQNGTSDYNVDSDGDRIGDYEAYFHRTNNIVPIEPGNGKPDDDYDDDDDQGGQKGIIYVDQVRGNDKHNGRAPSVSGKSRETRDRHGPKKTVGKGMAAVDKDRAHTLVIQSGAYNENLNIGGKNVRVVIEGNVKL